MCLFARPIDNNVTQEYTLKTVCQESKLSSMMATNSDNPGLSFVDFAINQFFVVKLFKINNTEIVSECKQFGAL